MLSEGWNVKTIKCLVYGQFLTFFFWKKKINFF